MKGDAQKVLDVLPLSGECMQTSRIVELTGIDVRAVSVYCVRLRARKLAEDVRPGCWRLTAAGKVARDAGLQLRPGPASPHTGRRIPPANIFRARVWTALRKLQKATVFDLIVLAGSGSERNPRHNVYRYLQALEKAGYVTKLQARSPGTKRGSNGFVKYLLIEDTGPLAPHVCKARTRLFDPNLDEEIDLGVAS